jgi:phosphoribosylformylglycinamidine synthase
MAPFEVMISESQERMLCVVEPERVDEVLAVCERWETRATAIGTVTDTGRLRVLDGECVVGDMPVTALVDECPLYDLEPARPVTPVYPAPRRTLETMDPGEVLLALVGSPNIASRHWAIEQYDSLVQSRTVRRPEQADAAVLALPHGGAIALSIDGNGRRVACDPYRGAVEAVLECAANLACVGAEPLGLTNCLNFGNPEKPHVAYQLQRAVEGLADACRALGVPVVGGNVSLYNEGAEGPIYPTPVVGMVGELPDPARAGRIGFARDGDAIALVGPFAPSLAGSELSRLRGEPLAEELPGCDPGEVRVAQAAIRQAVRSGALSSAHDVAEGGLAVALAECCIAGGRGAAVDLGAADDVDAALFAEGPGGFVVSGPAEALRAFGAAARPIGTVGGSELEIAVAQARLAIPVERLAAAHAEGLPRALA